MRYAKLLRSSRDRKRGASAGLPAPPPAAADHWRRLATDHGSTHHPHVTVIVTNYNYGTYVEECLAAIGQQTYSAFDCLVVDDASTDGSDRRIERFVAATGNGERFRLLRHERNGGQLAAMWTGLQRARGEFVTFVDADDLLLPDFLEAHVAAHLTFPPVAFTCASEYVIDGAGRAISGHDTPAAAAGVPLFVPRQRIWVPPWPWTSTSAMMFRRRVLELVFPETHDGYRICADNYLCHAANLVGGSLLLPTRHTLYRRHGGNNFADNAVLGRDITIHTPAREGRHDNTPDAIRAHLLAHRERFEGIMRKGLYLTMLTMVTPPEAVRRELLPGRGAAARLSRAERWRLARAVIRLRLRSKKQKRMKFWPAFGDVP